MFKVFSQQLPSYFNDHFIPNSAILTSDFHNLSLTSSALEALRKMRYINLYLLTYYSRTKSRQLSVVIYGAKSWNKLDDNLKQCRTLQNFKYKYNQVFG